MRSFDTIGSGSQRVWKIVQFGKFKDKGLTLPQILLRDPDWFFWAYDGGALHRFHSSQEAEELYHKATHILPSWQGHTNWRVEYSYLPPYGTFGFELVEPNRPGHEGSSTAIRKQFIDLSAGRAYKDYDKSGGKLLVECLKRIVFQNARLTKKRVEEFFANNKNFAKASQT